MEHRSRSSPESLLERGLEEIGAPAERTPPLADFARLVSRWAERMNLTGHSGPEAIARRLILDAVALGRVLGEPPSLADLGSGAGFPGIPLAILWPRARITLVESRERRHHFQRNAIRTLGLRNVETRHGRAEGIEASGHAVVVAQAMGEPREVLEWMTRWAEPGGLLALPQADPAPPIQAPSGVRPLPPCSYRVPLGGPGRIVWLGRREIEAPGRAPRGCDT